MSLTDLFARYSKVNKGVFFGNGEVEEYGKYSPTLSASVMELITVTPDGAIFANGDKGIVFESSSSSRKILYEITIKNDFMHMERGTSKRLVEFSDSWLDVNRDESGNVFYKTKNSTSINILEDTVTYTYRLTHTSSWKGSYYQYTSTIKEFLNGKLSSNNTYTSRDLPIPSSSSASLRGDMVIYDLAFKEDPSTSDSAIISAHNTIMSLGLGHTEPVIEVIEETKTEVIPQPATEYRDTEELMVGQERTVQEGQPGEDTVVYEVTYTDGIETERVEKSRTVITEALPTIIEKGTRTLITDYVTPEAPTKYANKITFPTVEGVVYRNYITKKVRSGSINLTSAGQYAYEAIPDVHPQPDTHEYVLQGTTYWTFDYKNAYTYKTVEVLEDPYIPEPERRLDDSLYAGQEMVIQEEKAGSRMATYRITYVDGDELKRELTKSVDIIPALPKITLYGTKPMPDSIDVTAVAPTQTLNTLTVPQVQGIQYVDLTKGEEVLEPGEHTISTLSVVIPKVVQEPGSPEFILTNPEDTWAYLPYDEIVPEAPQEFERYIIIPDVDGIEYFDGMTGEVYPAGEERMIGAKLVINTRLVAERAFLTNPGATWTYERTGGITALSPKEGIITSESFILPTHSQVEYIDKDTGKVLVHNAQESGSHNPKSYYSLIKSPTPSGLITVVPRAKGSAFLNNPYDEWQFGYFKRGMEIRLIVDEFQDEGDGWHKWAYKDEVFHEYVDVYIDGELQTEFQQPPRKGETFDIEIKLKERPPNKYAVDWERGTQGEPLENGLSLATSGATRFGDFEWTGDDTIIHRDYTWPTDGSLLTINIRVTELKHRVKPKPNLETQMLLGYTSENSITGIQMLESVTIPPRNYADYMKAYVNGKELTDWVSTGGTGNITMEPGYKEFKLTLTDPDFVWHDFSQVRRTGLHFSKSGQVITFQPDINGDLVWSGVWPEDETNAILLIYPFLGYITTSREVDTVRPPLNPEGTHILIPDDMFFYTDRDTGVTYQPGPLLLSRTIRITPSLRKKVVKEGNRYISYSIRNNNIFYTYTAPSSTEHRITALAPVQTGPIVTIPDSPDLFYWDLLEKEVVKGEINLHQRRYSSMRIRAFPRFEQYILTNADEVWFFTANTDVYSQRPMQSMNTITIPETFGVEYVNKDTGVVLKGTFPITTNISIKARATSGFTLKSITNEWTFEWVFIEKKRVTATEPTINQNWVTIPTVEGVRYVRSDTRETLQGTLYTQEPYVIVVEPASDAYQLTNPGAQWDIEPVATTQKEIILVDRDRRLIVHTNDTSVESNVFAVDIDTIVTLTLALKESSEFTSPPYLKDIEGVETPFTLSEDKRVATLEITFDDNTPMELHTGKIAQLTKPLYFMGENTTLEAKAASTGAVVTLQAGQTGSLTVGENYTFTVRAAQGHEFDRTGKVTYQGRTSNMTILPGNRLVAEHSLVSIQDAVFITMAAVMLTPSEPTKTIGFNNLYVVDKETLNEVSIEMLTRRRQFVIDTPGDGGLNYDSVLATDPHTYIINTIQLPFTIEEKDIANRERITLGFTQLFPSAQRLNTDGITVDLGQIRVKPKYYNTYDYKNVDVILHLPYMLPISIDPTFAIDQTISVEYIVDGYTGVATINVKSSLVGDKVFYSTQTQIGNEIPFISMKDGKTVDSVTESKTRLNNNTPVPFIQVVRHVPHEMDSPFNNLMRSSVGDMRYLSGRIVVHNIEMNLDITSDEETLLRNILSSGIIIK